MDPCFLIIGDLHIHLNNIDESEVLSNNLLKIAREHSFDVIVILGDILHTNNIIKAEAHVRASLLLGELSEIAPLLVLMGNHDIPHATSFLSNQHGFTQIKKWQGTMRGEVTFPSGTGVQLVDTSPIIFKVKGQTFGAVPYIPPGRFREALHTNPEIISTRAIFCHQEFSGCDLGHDQKSESKDSWDPHYPTIVSGHIHKHQTLFSNVLYVGSARQVAVTEEYYKTVSQIIFTKEGYSENRISTGLLPRIHYRIRADEVATLELPEKGQIKVEITGTSAENSVLKKNPKIRIWRRKGFIIKFHDLLEERETSDRDYSETAKMGFRGVCRNLAYSEGLEEEYDEIFS